MYQPKTHLGSYRRASDREDSSNRDRGHQSGGGYRNGGGGYQSGGGGGYQSGGYNNRRGGSSYRRGGGYNSRGGGYSRTGPHNNHIDWSQEDLSPLFMDNYSEKPVVANRSVEEVTEYYQQKDVTITGNSKNPVMSFYEAGFSDRINGLFVNQGFKEPTSIQAISWPNALSGNDLIGIAQTGSGKTLAYLLPAFAHISAQKKAQAAHNNPIALVVLPTRELAIQIEGEIKKYANPREVRYTCIYGGASKGPQLGSIERGCDLLIATPGRLIDYLESGKVSLKQTSFLVLDEADRMLDMGFEPQIRKIIQCVRPDRQTLMWSATWPRNIQCLARQFLKSPIKFQVGSTELAANHDIVQKVYKLNHYEKYGKLVELMGIIHQTDDCKTIIFCEKKRTCDQVTDDLWNDNFNVICIHGDKNQQERSEAINTFRMGKVTCLVATDVASRGLDVHDVRHVINYDFPGEIEAYVQRIGRTARAGQIGYSYSFFTKYDVKNAGRLIKILKEAKQEVPQDIFDMCAFSTGFGMSFGGRNNCDGDENSNPMYNGIIGENLDDESPNVPGEMRMVMMPGGPRMVKM